MTRPSVIAVVENDADVLRALARLLRAGGLAFESYPSAEQFLARTSAAPLSCLLADIDLDGMSGLDLHARLRADGVATPVVYLSGQPDPDLRAQAEALGCLAYLRKPCTAKLLFAALACAEQASSSTGAGGTRLVTT